MARKQAVSDVETYVDKPEGGVRTRWVVAAIVALAVVDLVPRYWPAAFPTLGTHELHQRWPSTAIKTGWPEPMDEIGIGGVSSGIALGYRQVYLRAGQTFIVDYQARIKTGCLWLYLRPAMCDVAHVCVNALERTPHEASLRATVSGPGRFQVPITHTALYLMTLQGSLVCGLPYDRDNPGYNLDYSASWRVR